MQQRNTTATRQPGRCFRWRHVHPTSPATFLCRRARLEDIRWAMLCKDKLRQLPEWVVPTSCTTRFSVWLFHCRKSSAAQPCGESTATSRHSTPSSRTARAIVRVFDGCRICAHASLCLALRLDRLARSSLTRTSSPAPRSRPPRSFFSISRIPTPSGHAREQRSTKLVLGSMCSKMLCYKSVKGQLTETSIPALRLSCIAHQRRSRRLSIQCTTFYHHTAGSAVAVCVNL